MINALGTGGLAFVGLTRRPNETGTRPVDPGYCEVGGLGNSDDLRLLPALASLADARTD